MRGPGRERRLTAARDYDLTQFNPDFFTRLRERISAAREKGLYASVMLFQGFSMSNKKERPAWIPKKEILGTAIHTIEKNNVNRVSMAIETAMGKAKRYTQCPIPRLTKLQEQYVKKMIDTLNDFDNIHLGNQQ